MGDLGRAEESASARAPQVRRESDRALRHRVSGRGPPLDEIRDVSEVKQDGEW